MVFADGFKQEELRPRRGVTWPGPPAIAGWTCRDESAVCVR